MAVDAFLNSIKYEQHGPAGDGCMDAIQAVKWAEGFRTIDLFAGIGGIRLGFESVGGRAVFSSEWDTEAQDTYEANFHDRPVGDITKVAPEDIPAVLFSLRDAI
jgi:predicted RNA methylase